MELRFRLGLVTGAGSALGRDVAVRLARAGAAVVVADPDEVAARATVDAVRRHRVWACAVQVDTRLEDDALLLAARVHDLGGVALVIDPVGGPHAPLLRRRLDDQAHPPRWVDAETLARCPGPDTIRLLRAG